MDKKKVSELASSYSLSCKKLVKDNQLIKTIKSPAVVLVALTVVNMFLVGSPKSVWSKPM